jgi:hypothetical protein
MDGEHAGDRSRSYAPQMYLPSLVQPLQACAQQSVLHWAASTLAPSEKQAPPPVACARGAKTIEPRMTRDMSKSQARRRIGPPGEESADQLIHTRSFKGRAQGRIVRLYRARSDIHAPLPASSTLLFLLVKFFDTFSDNSASNCRNVQFFYTAISRPGDIR